MRVLQAIALFVEGFVAGLLLVWFLSDVPIAEADYGNPWGHRAGGRFDYYQYDDAMEILTDTRTGQEYLVWYWRDDVEVVPLGTRAEVSE